MTILNSKYSTKLEIFEKFKLDKSLPKFTEIPEHEITARNSGKGRNQNTAVYSGETSVFSTTSTTATGSYIYTGDMSDTRTVYITTNNGSTDTAVSMPKAVEDQGVVDDDIIITINDFFGYVRHRGDLLSNMRYRRRVKALLKMLDQCERTGQRSLKDMTASELDRLKMEYILCANKFKIYVCEKYIVEAFKHLSEEDQDLMELEWIKDFNRIIPRKIIDRKAKADKLHVFDNYVILHVRPGWYGKKEDRMSSEDTDKLKDPILFGVMNCSRRLYYIGDWLDSQCMLTLSELIDKFGEGSLDLNKDFSRTNPYLPFEKNPLIPHMEK